MLLGTESDTRRLRPNKHRLLLPNRAALPSRPPTPTDRSRIAGRQAHLQQSRKAWLKALGANACVDSSRKCEHLIFLASFLFRPSAKKNQRWALALADRT